MRFLTFLLLILFLQTGFSLFAQEKKVEEVTTTTDQKEEEPPEIEITTKENRLIVSNAPIGSILEIYNVVGVKVKELKMKEASGEYTLDIAKGYYIIRIGETVRKIAIR